MQSDCQCDYNNKAMPKKTKKEKILAAYRKKLRLLEQSNIKSPPSLTSEVNVRTTNTRTSEVKQTEKIAPPKYFFLDLRKSLILVSIIIAVEIGLYFAKLIK